MCKQSKSDQGTVARNNVVLTLHACWDALGAKDGDEDVMEEDEEEEDAEAKAEEEESRDGVASECCVGSSDPDRGSECVSSSSTAEHDALPSQPKSKLRWNLALHSMGKAREGKIVNYDAGAEMFINDANFSRYCTGSRLHGLGR